MKVLISPGFGAGWSTWNSGEVAKYMRTYQPIIECLEQGNKVTRVLLAQLEKECEEKFNEDHVCVLGADQLVVMEVPLPFKIDEYDGSESISTQNDTDWITE